MIPPQDISRREAVQRLTILVGGALSAPTVSALLSGCQAAPVAPSWTPEVLSASQLDVLNVVVDLILPRTDTPGATDVGVPAFIDVLLDRWADDEQREQVLAGLDGLGADFLASGTDAQTTTLTALDAEAVQAREDDVSPLPFFGTIKEWTLSGYYTSEAGATEELQWLALPGRFDADVPLSEVGRTWA